MPPLSQFLFPFSFFLLLMALSEHSLFITLENFFVKVRRLRIQLRLKSMEEQSVGMEEEEPEYKSFIPFLPLMVRA